MELFSLRMWSCVLELITLLSGVIASTVTLSLDGSPGSYVRYPPWQPCLNASISFKFMTQDRHALLLYLEHGSDFLEVQLLMGSAHLRAKIGGHVVTTQTGEYLDDNKWHTVNVRLHSGLISQRVDDAESSKHFPTAWQSYGPESSTDDFLFFGGLPLEYANEKFTTLSLPSVVFEPKFRGAVDQLFYQNCDGEFFRPRPLEYGGVSVKDTSLCNESSCLNGGRCRAMSAGLMCDCAHTGYRGNRCELPATTLRFDGFQFLKVSMTTELVTEVDEILLRFRTMYPNGLLFMTSGHQRGSIVLYLDGGTLFLSVDLERGEKVLSNGHNMNDNSWHTVFIKRTMQTIEMAIDEQQPVAADLPGPHAELGTLCVEIGHVAQSANGNTHPGFIGYMQAFIYDGMDFFQMAKLDMGNNVQMSAHFSSDELEQKPVTFKSGDAYTVLPRLQIHSKYSVTLQLKTVDSSGLILYNGEQGQAFFAMELVDGFLYFVYDMGDGPRRVKAYSREPVNDNKWHQILLLRTEPHKQLLRVDDNVPTVDDPSSSAGHSRFNLSGQLYVGGASKEMFPDLPKLIYSRHGFVGCLGSVDLNGYIPDLVLDATQIHGSVDYGCMGPLTKCVNSSCANNGRCVQQWPSYRCDCDMTSFTGPECKDASVSYKFGSSPGLVSYSYPDVTQLSVEFDSLAFGLQTFQADAMLIRVESKEFNNFIQLELIQGHVYVTYSMDIFVLHLANFNQKVNDGKYHVVQLTKVGPNATLQVDSTMPQRKNSTGHHSHIFNSQTVITVGGKKANGSITEHFDGVISGLVFNGIHLLELAKQKDPAIHIEGDVILNVGTSFTRSRDWSEQRDVDQMMSIEADTGAEEEATDDIIFAGTDQSCYTDIEEDCSAIDSGNDEIITAVVIIKTTTSLPTTTERQEPKCDDPECEKFSKLMPLGPDMTASPSHTGRGSSLDRGDNGDIYSSEHNINEDLNNYDSTEEPGKTSGNKSRKNNKEINLGLILGISISVLVAVIVLAIALYKLRSRNEGIYKVDETQNFSSLQPQKPVGNGIVASGSDSEPSSKRGRMKDVKEWYV